MAAAEHLLPFEVSLLVVQKLDGVNCISLLSVEQENTTTKSRDFRMGSQAIWMYP